MKKLISTNYTLLGSSSVGFCRAIQGLGNKIRSAFVTKHGIWAVSLEDGQLPPSRQILHSWDVMNVIVAGEMTFGLETISDHDGFLDDPSLAWEVDEWCNEMERKNKENS